MNEELLKNKQIRVTDFRLAVLNVFLQSENAVSTETIENALGTYDRITLYRTLKTFINKGLIHEIILPGESKKMALCGTGCSSKDHNHQHMHFHCNDCDEVFCLPLSDNHNIAPQDFKVDFFEVIANGTCKSCLSA